MTFLTNLGVTQILYSLELVLEEKTVKEVPESSRLEFLKLSFQETILLYATSSTHVFTTDQNSSWEIPKW